MVGAEKQGRQSTMATWQLACLRASRAPRARKKRRAQAGVGHFFTATLPTIWFIRRPLASAITGHVAGCPGENGLIASECRERGHAPATKQCHAPPPPRA